jgi:RND family efflux transporter MFP subunit
MADLPGKNRPRSGIWTAAAIVVGLAPGCARAEATPVTAAEAHQAPIVREVALTGTVTSPRSASLSTAIGGLVEHVAVDAGDRAAEGDLLLALDDELEEAAVMRAEAAVRRGEVELADAQRRLREAQALSADHSIPETTVRSTEAEVRVAEAALEVLRADERLQAARLERHRLRAPFDGVVSRKLTEMGEWIEPGTAVLELVATDDLRVDFQVPQEYAVQLATDSQISVELGGAPGRWFEGRIAAVVPVTDPEARSFLVRVLLQDADDVIAPGMSAHGQLQVSTHERGVVVPRDATLRHPDGRVTVWVIDDSGTVSERRIEPGPAFAELVHVRNGLEPGERVVVQGNEALRDGQLVAIRGDR